MSLYKRIKEWLREYHRFVIMNDTTFEEKIVFRLRPLSIFVTVIITILILIFLSISLVAFTSLREYIPGYGSNKQAQKIAMLHAKTDSLNNMIANIESYEKGLKVAILGESFMEDTTSNSETEKTEATFSLTYYDSLLMQIKENKPAFEQTKQSQIVKTQNKDIHAMFYPPLRGEIQRESKGQPQGISIFCKQGTSIFAPASGTVIHVGYDPLKGTTLIINHPNNILTIYQQAGTPLIEVGGIVNAKQAIAVTDFDQIVYFELWIDGMAVNPKNYMLF